MPISAQEPAWPSQPIKIVVPYAPGGSADAFARQFGEQLSRELGQTVIVDNRPGASTNIGATSVVRARPDGYTLLLGSLQQVLSPVFGPNPGFELLTSFEPVSLLARMPFVVAANPKVPFNNAPDEVADVVLRTLDEVAADPRCPSWTLQSLQRAAAVPRRP